jgi:prepilin-type N-terminal cleavage/methylation domain-containing protein
MKTIKMNLSRNAPNALSGAAKGFTLIELLVVISIIAVLAGFTLVVINRVERTKNISIAQAELAQIATALDAYKSQYGVYPPSNPKAVLIDNPPIPNPIYLSPLYYELIGVTNDLANKSYDTLDAAVQTPTNTYIANFNLSSPLNVARPGNDPENIKARSFLLGLKPNRIGPYTNNSVDSTHGVNLRITSVRGPDPAYQPLGVPNLNPFRYLYPGTNNPNSYDLWVQLVISGKTNLICNWTKQVIIGSPLP